MPTNLELARPISGNVEIGSVNLRSADVSSHIDPVNGAPDDIFLQQNFRAWGEVRRGEDDAPDSIIVSVELHFEAAKTPPSPDSDAAPVFSLAATYVLVYTLKEAAEINALALQAFAELNGPYNAWPYWRELVHTVTGRVGLATIVIPVFKLPVREMPIEDQDAPRPETKRRATRKRKPTET
jgi:hypothetical protein